MPSGNVSDGRAHVTLSHPTSGSSSFTAAREGTFAEPSKRHTRRSTPDVTSKRPSLR